MVKFHSKHDGCTNTGIIFLLILHKLQNFRNSNMDSLLLFVYALCRRDENLKHPKSIRDVQNKN